MNRLEAAKILNNMTIHGIKIQFSNEFINEVSGIVETKEKLLEIVKEIEGPVLYRKREKPDIRIFKPEPDTL